MSYSSGGVIEATDYNTRASTVNSIWGTGSGSYGYGQSSLISSVAATNTVAATNWASLIARLDTIRAHQSGVTSGITQPSAGNTISYLSALDTQLSTATSNRNNSTPSGSAIIGNPQIANGTTWYGVNTKEVYFSWSSTDTVRYFFNAGGRVNCIWSQAGGTTTKYVYWNAFLGNVIGTFTLGANSCSLSGTGGTRTVQNTNIGYHQLTTAYQRLFLIYQAYGVADYNNNYIDIYAKVGGSLYGAGSNVVYILAYMVDNAADTFNDAVNGTNYTYTYYQAPVTTYLANTWGVTSCTTSVNIQ